MSVFIQPIKKKSQHTPEIPQDMKGKIQESCQLVCLFVHIFFFGCCARCEIQHDSHKAWWWSDIVCKKGTFSPSYQTQKPAAASCLLYLVHYLYDPGRHYTLFTQRCDRGGRIMMQNRRKCLNCVLNQDWLYLDAMHLWLYCLARAKNLVNLTLLPAHLLHHRILGSYPIGFDCPLGAKSLLSQNSFVLTC